MNTAVMMFCVIAGLFLLPTYLPVGLVLLYTAYVVERRASAGDEEGFLAGLMVLGGAGAIAVVITYVWDKITA